MAFKEFIPSSRQPVILITGGARLLGVSLAKKLSAKKYRLVLVDNLSVGNYLNPHLLKIHKNISFINCDINQGIPQSIKGVDYIFHLASTKTSFSGNPPTSLYDLKINSSGTQKILDLAVRSNARLVYTSSILLYQSAIEKIRSNEILGENLRIEGSHADAKRFGESLIEQHIQNTKVDARIVRLPHIYGPGMNLSADTPLGQILDGIISENKVTLRGEGVDKHYYLYLEDALEGLIKAMFVPKGRGLIFPLIPDKAVTQLEITNELSQLLKTEVTTESRDSSSHTPLLHIEDLSNLTLLNWKPTTLLAQGLQDTLNSLPSVTPTDEEAKVTEEKHIGKRSQGWHQLRKSISTKSKTLVKNKGRRKKSWDHYRKIITLSFITLILGYITLSPLIFLGYHAKKGAGDLMNSNSNLKTFNFEEGKKNSTSALYHFQQAEKIASSSRNIFALLSYSQQVGFLKQLITTGTLLSKAGESANEGANTLASAFLKSTPTLINGETRQELSQELFQQTLSDFSSAQNYTLLAEAEIKGINLESLPFQSWKTKVIQTQEQVGEAQSYLSQVKLLNQALPRIMGYSQAQTFLILIQNSNEIRASGGFIGSLAEVTINEGAISSIRVDDVYNPDGALIEKNIIIEPPPPIRDILGQTRWFLRDSNWDADFAEASEDIKRFYFLETGKKVDNVIALDLRFIQKILEVTGPIRIATYDEEVSSNNLFEKAELYSESNFVPGTSFKKAFLTTLSQQLITSLVQMNQGQYADIAKAFYTSLGEKHLLLNSNIQAMQKLVKQNNWAGTIGQENTNYLYVLDSNLGANKANYYVTRSIDFEAESPSKEGKQVNKTTITYVHTGTSDNWPGGKYNNYLRVLIPPGSHLLSATQNQSESKEKNRDVTKEISVLEEAGKTVFAKHLELEHGQSLTLVLRYELPQDLATELISRNYKLIVQKQPGTEGDPLVVTITPPFGRNVASYPSNMEKTGRSFRYAGKLTQDQVFDITMD